MTNRLTPQLERIGTILSGSTTFESAFQPLEAYENEIVEGKLVVIHCLRTGTEILGRISSIVPHNLFYSEGDAFSEARRKGMSIPGDIAKQYQVCKVESSEYVFRNSSVVHISSPIQ